MIRTKFQTSSWEELFLLYREFEEKLKLFKVVKEAVGDNARVIAGTTDNNNSKSIELSVEAQKLGVDALLLTVPAYNKPTQQGLLDHFYKIADSVEISTQRPC